MLLNSLQSGHLNFSNLDILTFLFQNIKLHFKLFLLLCFTSDYFYIKYFISYSILSEYKTYIHHKSHRFCWYWHTHDCPGEERSFLDIWFCKQAEDIWLLMTVFLCLRNLLGRDSWPQGGIHHTQTTAIDLCTVHECHL